MQILKYISVILFTFLSVGITAQEGGPDDPSQKVISGTDAFQKRYEKNIKLTRINGVYIPADLEEAFEELTALADEASLEKFKAAPEEVISRKLHFGLGRWISLFWNLEEGSRYEHYLRELGLVSVDDMIQFTIVSFHRHLSSKDLQIESRVADYQRILANRLKQRREKSEVISTESRPIKE